MTNNTQPNQPNSTEWIQQFIEEARNDPVGMWRIVRGGREIFNLSDAALDAFVRDFIFQLVSSGAAAVHGDRAAAYGWSPILKFGHNPKDIADGLMKEWYASNTDPDFGGAWFAFPGVWQ